MRDGAKRSRPPKGPPLGCSPAERQEWFAALRAVDADVTQYTVGITLKHLARAGVAPHAELPNASDWKGFALYLMLTLSPTLDGGGDKGWVGALLADLVEYSLLNPSGSPENRLAELLAQFIQWADYERREEVIKLLPPQAEPALKLIEAWEEEEQRRQGEPGY
jgi:hypothetical protein